ncbi:mitochondrial sodium/calcium exchanger protein isoform X5 [Phascolarctos cinereus]|uniref:Sodium/potassium/calcium exchanger 6, mitochondrial isoform X5 n=1 Tax=Phascolarctos cinereus TaxID=38626 RepID=A0A6P5JRU1_PHACI|nr:sodium/potassium/calcium exchanger 6, mitochondrial isoform X5 [Phascolarctos cinereus]
MGGSWALSHLQLLGWLWLLRGTCPVLGTGPATQAGSPGPGTVQEGMDSTVDMDCRKVRSLNDSESCVFVLTNPDCQRNGGYFDYLKGVFCFFPPDLLPLAVTLYVLWLFYLFLFLAVTAEKFFCPNLSAISITLKLSHNVAGVTFLAFGNGAPDVFSVLVAFSNSHTAGLGIGALFGAGVLVTTVVAGGIAIIRPFTAASRPFFRDIIFYMAAIFMTFTALYIGKVTLAWGLGYLAFYAFYVFTVVLSTWIYRRHSVAVLSHSPPDPPILPVDSEDRSSSVANSYDYADEYGPQLHEEKSTVWILTRSLTPLDYQTWKRKPYYWKFVKAFKMPVEFLMLLTVPLVDLDRDDRNWKRPLNCLHLLISPVVCVMTLQSGVYVVSDLTLAQQGYPRMAFSACFGGIIFNILVGVGLGCVLEASRSHVDVKLESEGLLVWVLAGALGLSLLFSLISVPLQCFHLNKVYGFCLLFFYLSFLIVALLTEFGVIHGAR